MSYAQSKVSPRGSARFVIFVMLEGGQSHVDSWDLKEGKWTPPNFDIREIAPGVKWPMSLFPQLAQAARTIFPDSFDGSLGQRALPRPVLRAVGAHDESCAAEGAPADRLGRRLRIRRTSAARPTRCPAMSPSTSRSHRSGLLGSGFLPATYTPFHVDTTSGIGAIAIDDDGRKKLLRRWELLKKFDERLAQRPVAGGQGVSRLSQPL